MAVGVVGSPRNIFNTLKASTAQGRPAVYTNSIVACGWLAVIIN